MVATRMNMRIAREQHGNTVVMLDLNTGNTYSAHPDDYFFMPENEVFLADGEPMILIVPFSGYYTLDDDGEIYYGGRLVDDDECMSQDAALSFGMNDAGCTTIEVKRNDEWIQEIA